MTNAFTGVFGKYVCEGDNIVAEKDGFTVVARIVRDDCSEKPDERDEGFWPSLDRKALGWIGDNPAKSFEEQTAQAKRIMAAWENDEWFYCGIVLRVEKAVTIKGRAQCSVVLSDHAASLWGIECNFPDSDNSYLTEVANELLGEALTHAKECLKQIAA